MKCPKYQYYLIRPRDQRNFSTSYMLPMKMEKIECKGTLKAAPVYCESVISSELILK